MKKSSYKITLFLTMFYLSTTSCKKEISCYDEKLYQEHKNDFCTMDCPGVMGCDGKKYCNECIANSKGIRVIK